MAAESKAWQELSTPLKRQQDAPMRDSFGSSLNLSLRKKAQSLAKLKAQQVDKIEKVSSLSYRSVQLLTFLTRSLRTRSTLGFEKPRRAVHNKLGYMVVRAHGV